MSGPLLADLQASAIEFLADALLADDVDDRLATVEALQVILTPPVFADVCAAIEVCPTHLCDEQSASRVALANQLATAEAEKEALRASKSALVEKVKRLQDQIARANMEPGQDRQKAMHAYAARTEAAEAALAGLVAAVEALAQASLQDGRGGAWVHDVWFRALIDADHAAALRAHEALAWDDAVTEGFDGGWLHDAARDDMLARNPYRADSIEQAHP
jgi:hypothetical protein